MVLRHRQPVLSHIGVRLQLLLDHVHVLHRVRVHAVLDLGHVPSAEGVQRLLLEQVVKDGLLLSCCWQAHD